MPAQTTQPAQKVETPAPAKPQSPPSPPPPAPAPAAPAPEAPAAAPAYRSLDDDLIEAAAKPSSRSQKRGKEPAKPEQEPTAPTAVQDAAAGKPASTTPPPAQDEDYLMGQVPPAKPTAPEPPKPAEEPPTGPLKAPELRAEYAKVKKRVADLEKELADVKAKPPEAKPLEEAERKAFVEEVSTLKKQVGDLTGALKTVAYEQSDEYKTKYEKPFLDAWQEGAQLVSSLTVTDPEGNTRKGTADDFQRIMREPDNELAASLAQEMFGPNAFYVLAQRRDIQRVHNQRVKALDEFRSTLSQREKLQAETAKKHQEEAEGRRVQQTALWNKFNTQATTKHPEFFAPVEGDEAGNALLEKGYKDADLAFSGAPELTDERRVQLHSAIRNRAAAFGRLVHQLRTKDTQITELKKELEELKGSTPGDGQVPREGAAPKPLSADEEIEAAARQYR